MRRLITILIPFLFATVVIFAVSAQEPRGQDDGFVATAVPTSVPLTPSDLSDIYAPPYLLEQIEAPPQAFDGGENEDSCDQAVEMEFPIFGDQIDNVQDFGFASTDPNLSCMWGNPSRANGYRTGWYKLTALANASLTLNTVSSNYDTVIGVYTSDDIEDPCSSLSELACNDDFSGFSSKVTFTALQGETYYIMVADWSQSSSGQLILNIFLELEPVNSRWELVDNNESGARTHHAVAVANGNIYVVGGQTSVLGSNPVLSNRLSRYNPGTNSWNELAQMPGLGLTNLSAVYLNDRIYVPGGDNNAPNSFSNTHFVYHVGSDFWSTVAAVPVGVGWAAAVVAPDLGGYFLTGGTNTKDALSEDANALANVYFYDQNNNWNTRPSMNSARYGHTAVRLGDRVCVIGGIQGLTILSSGECLGPTASSWVSIPSLNIPRFGAGSAVGPDGRWYVFGGATADISGALAQLATTEVYDPASPEGGWQVLDVPYDLVDPETVLARQYPRGGFIGEELYAIGGNHFVPVWEEFDITPLVQRLHVSRESLFVPLILRSGQPKFDDNMGAARFVPRNRWVSGRFDKSTDFHDFYYFDLTTATSIEAQLNGIPSSSDYDLYVYNNNKVIWGSSSNPGSSNESISLTLGPGRYFVLVLRVTGQAEDSSYSLAVWR